MKIDWKKKGLSAFVVFTLIFTIFSFVPNAGAIIVEINNLELAYEKGETITIIAEVLIEDGERIPINNMFLEIAGASNQDSWFNVDGSSISVPPWISITLLSEFNSNYGYGYGYDYYYYDYGYRYGYDHNYGYGYGEGFEFGYGYGYVGILKYQIEIDSSFLNTGNHSMQLHAETGNIIHEQFSSIMYYFDIGDSSNWPLRIAIQNDFKTLNPLAASDAWNWNICDYIYESPVAINHETGGIMPYIAVGSANTSTSIDTGDLDWADCDTGVFEFTPKSTWGWEDPSSDVGEVIIFYDFNNVTFHDDTQMDIRDVLFSYHAAAQNPKTTHTLNCLKDEAGGGGSNYSSDSWLWIFNAWESGDGKQAALKFVLQEPYNNFYEKTLGITILPEHIWVNQISGQNVDGAKIWLDSGYDLEAPNSWKVDLAMGYDNSNPVGSGTYTFDHWSPGTISQVNTWRDHFYDENYPAIYDPMGYAKQPFIDNVIFKIYKTSEAAILSIKNNQTDIIGWSVPPVWVDTLQNDTAFEITTSLSPGFSYFGLNMRLQSFGYDEAKSFPYAPEDDLGKPLRRAITHCINLNVITSVLMNDYGISSVNPVSQLSLWFNESVPRYSFDPTEAQNILNSAGYFDYSGDGWLQNPDGTPIGSGPEGRIEILTPAADYNPMLAQTGLMVASQLQSIGIRAVSVAMDFGTIVNRIAERDFDMYLLEWKICDEPPEFFYPLFHSSSSQASYNFIGYQNQSFDVILDEARSSGDQGIVVQKIDDAQAAISYDVPLIPVYHPINIDAIRAGSYVGWYNGSCGSILNFKSLRDIIPVTPPIFDPVHNIDTNEYFTEIQTAIDDPDTLDGHTIEVASKIYYEDVVVTKSLTINGANRDTTIIDASGSGDAVKIKADNVLISGFTIRNATTGWWDQGIYINSNNTAIMHNIIELNSYGISFEYSSNLTIQDNIVRNNAVDAIEGNKSISSIQILQNTIYNNRNAIALGHNVIGLTTDNLVNGNIIYNNSQVGIWAYRNNNTIISGNTINNHTGAPGQGIYLQEGGYNLVCDNQVYDSNDGIGCWNSNSNTIYHNTIVNNVNQAFDNGINSWDNGYPSGGNYWSDYTGVDFNSTATQDVPPADGIGDTPYTNIAGGAGALDNYPLMEPMEPVSNYTQHLPIRINSNADFDEAHGVVNWATGDGTEGNPWIIEGWDINGTGYGYCIYVGNTTEYYVVENCYLHEAIDFLNWPYYTASGILLYNADNGILTKNVVSNNGFYGIFLDASNKNTIDSNTVSNSGFYGIIPSRSKNLVITNNSMKDDDGITIDGDFLVHWNTHSIDISNTVNGKPVYYWKNQTSGTVPLGAGQVILANCTNVIVENQALDSASIAIEIGFSDHCVISNNIATNGTHGIVLLLSSNNTLANNNFSSNEYFGIYLWESINNTIKNNMVSNNNGYGIHLLSSSDGNIIYHNNIINNIDQAYDTGTNSWDNGYPDGGNYWSDYTGVDFNSTATQDVPPADGIGDTPYTNIGINQDNYPLMEPWVTSSPPPIIYNVTLSTGWNLISLPLVQSNENIDTVLASIDGDWDRVKLYDSQSLNPWLSSSIYSQNLSEVDLLDHTVGIWIHMVNATNFTVEGIEPVSTDITLYAGWNLVGYPTLNDSMNVANALWGTGADQVEVCDLAEPGLIREIGPTYVMQPGEGYWIHVPADTVWTIDW